VAGGDRVCRGGQPHGGDLAFFFFSHPFPSQRKGGVGSRDVTFGFGFRSLKHWDCSDVPRAVPFDDTGFFEPSPTIVRNRPLLRILL